jgi:hypothetical protein
VLLGVEIVFAPLFHCEYVVATLVALLA